MADFVAVLKKTLDGLTETTPQMREKVYEKARLTIAGKLAAMNPPPPPGVIDRQKRALEDAIAEIEREFAPAKPGQVDPLTELENVFASLKNPDPLAVLRPQPKPAEAAPKPAPLASAPQPAKPVEAPRQAVMKPEIDPVLEPEAELNFDDEPDDGETIAADDRPRRSRSLRGPLVALMGVLVAAVAAYGVWTNRAAFGDMLGLGGAYTAAVQPEPETPTPEPAPEPEPAVASAEPEQPAEEAAPAPAAPAPAAEGETKYTQRLNADGSEVDAGPAGGQPVIGEGTSVASVSPGAPATEPLAPAEPPVTAAETPPAATPETPAEDTAATALPVGQRAIFYEERTNVAEASAEPGSIVWSLVQESPGNDLPAEAAIRGEATIPSKDVQLRVTIRRNADQTLPASHIIEVIFLTPDGFEGGGIDNVLRISMKGSEQEAGSPLIGIPAKIADGYFLIALNDSKPEIDANLTLLRRQSWIDVPVQYKSGRRALFTMEKGIPGTKVFDDAIKAWQAATTTASTPG